MTLDVISDVGGHSLTLHCNGAKLTMDLVTAEQAVLRINQTLDRLYADQVAKHQQDALYKQLNTRAA